MRYLLLLALIMSMLAGCATTTQPAPDGVSDGVKANNWKKRQLILAALPSWNLIGRASVTYRGDNWPFGIEWQQFTPVRYNMNIKHPLTQNTVADVVKDANSVSLTANGRTYQDNSAERLIENHLRVRLPVDGMQYWVLGTSAPGYPVSSVKLDGLGRPVSLEQAGWTIQYSDYQKRKIDALPGLIKVSRSTPQPVQVKMRVRQWSQ